MNRSQIIAAGGAAALLVGATAALSSSSQNSGSSAALPFQSSSMLLAPSPVAPSSVLPPDTSPVPTPAAPAPAPASSAPTYYSQRITTCAGQQGNANFRAYPSLDPRVVLGVVAHGDVVQLTGRVIRADGVKWFEAIAPALAPAPGGENRIEPNQVGWIASCFVSG